MSLVTKALGVVLEKTLLRPATVAGVTSLGGFRLLELRGDALKANDWSPGDKLRIKVGDLDLRTYTPLSWDDAEGATRLLAWLPGRGPGSEWASSARVGDPVYVKGPEESLKLAKAEGRPVAFFGDETAVGAAAALRLARPGDDLRFVFELDAPEEAQVALIALGLGNAARVAKRPDGAHQEEAAALLADAARGWTERGRVFLVGNQASVKALKPKLEATLGERAKVKAKVYWREGKVGLD